MGRWNFPVIWRFLAVLLSVVCSLHSRLYGYGSNKYAIVSMRQLADMTSISGVPYEQLAHTSSRMFCPMDTNVSFADTLPCTALLSVSVAAVGMFAVYFVAKWTGQLSKFMGAREKNKDATSTTTTDAASGGNTEANISIPTAVVADLGVVVQDSVAKWADKLSQLKSAGDKSKGTTTTTTTAETPATSQSVATAEAINPQASMTASVESAAPITDPEQMPSNQGSADSQDPVEDVLGVDGAKQHKQKGNRDWLFWAKPSYWRGSGKKQGQQAADTPASPGTA